MPGSTRVWNSPSTSPPRTFTAPISVIALSVGEPPVVSRSTTTKVTADRGVPSSSIVACSYRVAGDGAAAPARGPGSTPGEEGTGRTVGRGADSPGDARRGSYDPRRVSQRRDEGPPAGPPGRVPRPLTWRKRSCQATRAVPADRRSLRSQRWWNASGLPGARSPSPLDGVPAGRRVGRGGRRGAERARGRPCAGRPQRPARGHLRRPGQLRTRQAAEAGGRGAVRAAAAAGRDRAGPPRPPDRAAARGPGAGRAL